MARETIARERRDHDVERVVRSAAEICRLRERSDELDLLEDRARPTVGHDQWKRTGLRRLGMDEMDVDAVDVGDELPVPIQCRLRLAPVVPVCPVRHQLLELGAPSALRAIRDGLLVGPSRAPDTPPKLIEFALWHSDREGTERCVPGRLGGRCSRRYRAGVRLRRRRCFARTREEQRQAGESSRK
jgi:hypothetical protein